MREWSVVDRGSGAQTGLSSWLISNRFPETEKAVGRGRRWTGHRGQAVAEPLHRPGALSWNIEPAKIGAFLGDGRSLRLINFLPDQLGS